MVLSCRKLLIVLDYVLLACHWSIKMYTGLPLIIQSVYWPIIGHLYCMKSFFIGTINSFKLQDGDIVESGLVETKENGMTEIPLNDANTMNEKPVKKVTIQDNKSNRYRNKQYV